MRSCRWLSWVPLVVGLLTVTPASAQDPGSAAAAAPQSADADVPMAPVQLDGVELFRVRGVSSFPAADRARLISERLAQVAADRSVPVESLRIVEEPNVSRIQAGDQPIMGVADTDASIEQVERAELAGAHLFRLRQAITGFRNARSASALRASALNGVVATLVFGALLFGILWAWRVIDRVLTARLASRIHSVGIQSFEVMRAEWIWDAVRGALIAVRTAVILGVGLLYLGFVLAQFPRTRGLSRNMAAFALGPLEVIGSGVVAHIPSLVFLAVLFYLFRLVLRILRLFFEAIQHGGVKLASFEPEWSQPTYRIIRILLIAFALIVAYPYIPGSQSEAFRGVSLFLGVVFSLGSSTAISNIIAGYMLTYRRAFKIGDRIKVGDAIGDVVEMRMQVTHLRSVKNEELIIPNSQILSGEVMNYSSLSRGDGLILHTEVGIGYETPWRQVEAMLLLAAERTTGLAREPQPFVLEKKLGDFAVVYELNAYCGNVPAMTRVYAEMHRNILDVFNEYGVQIMTPAYEGDPPEPKIVHPKDWHAAPAPGVAPVVARMERSG